MGSFRAMVTIVLSAVVDPVVIVMMLSVVLLSAVVRAVVFMMLLIVVDSVGAVIVVMLSAVVDSVRDVVVMASSFKELILSGSVCTDRLTIAILIKLSCMLCWPNIRALSPVGMTPFLMLLGDQLVLLHGKRK